jgi:type III pantothenate kinase
MVTLTLDVGNTRIKAALFEQGHLLREAKWPVLSLDDLWQWLHPHVPQACLMASSGKLHDTLADGLRARLRFYHLTTQLPLPIAIHYDTPHTLGADRIAGSVGAYYCAGRQSVLKVDCGTCVTYDLVTAGGVFEGGAIAPGLHMRTRAMHAHTARLPEVSVPDVAHLVGKSTTTALQSGTLNGWQLEILGFVNRFRQDYNIQTVVVTGGDAHLFPAVAVSVIKQPVLVHLGMQHILQHLIDINHPTT